jgi:hypothetical protein
VSDFDHTGSCTAVTGGAEVGPAVLQLLAELGGTDQAFLATD